MMFCHGLKGEFGSMFIRVVTVSRMRFFLGRFEAAFLTTEAKVRGQRSDPPSSKALWRAEAEGKRSLSGRGVFKRTGGCKACQTNVGGLFCILEAYQGEGVVRFEKRLWANVYGAWHGGTL